VTDQQEHAKGLRWLAAQVDDGLVEVIKVEHYSEQPAADGGLDRTDGLPYPKAYVLHVRYKVVALE
jgi:hypothetical protein